MRRRRVILKKKKRSKIMDENNTLNDHARTYTYVHETHTRNQDRF